MFLFFNSSVSDAGSDWSTIYFLDVASRQKLDDVILRTKFSSLRWTTDNRGIFYATYADALENDEKKENDTVKKYSFVV
jgi:prolyl oligopeptidase